MTMTWWDLGKDDETGAFGVLYIGASLQLVWVWAAGCGVMPLATCSRSRPSASVSLLDEWEAFKRNPNATDRDRAAMCAKLIERSPFGWPRMRGGA